jgi:hypothetical protein
VTQEKITNFSIDNLELSPFFKVEHFEDTSMKSLKILQYIPNQKERKSVNNKKGESVFMTNAVHNGGNKTIISLQ